MFRVLKKAACELKNKKRMRFNKQNRGVRLIIALEP